MEKNIIDLLKNDLIELDACFAMHPKFSVFVEKIELNLMTFKKKIIVRKEVVGELYRLINSPYKHKKELAGKAIETIFLKKNIFEIHDKNLTDEYIQKSFADAEFISSFSKKRLKNRIALLTNDYNLGKDIQQLNHFSSCNGKEISLFSLTPTGELTKNNYEYYQKKDDVKEEDLNSKNEIKKTDWSEFLIPSLISFTSFAIGYTCHFYTNTKNLKFKRR